MAVIRKIKLPNEASARDIGALSSNVIYDGDTGVPTTLNDKIQSIFTAIGDINSFEIAIVSELPATGDDHTIYFVPESEGSTTHNEYMYIDNQWELIGTTTIDLSDYALKTDLVQSDWTQTTDTELDFIKNKPAIWDSEDYTVPSGQTYGDSTTKAIGAVALNLKTNSAKGNYSVSEGYQPTGTRKVTINGVSTTLPYGASGNYSHAEGYYTIASGRYSHTEGQNTVAHGSHSHVEGFYAIASGNYSHAEGEGSVASGDCSHAEGNSSTASDASSHAEGNSTVASGVSSHAEGHGSKASSYYSHAEGYQTIAQRKSQHVFGEYNVSDTTGSASTRGTYVEIVGNGASSSARSNARTLDWNGNEWLAGKVTVANLTPTADGDLTTKQYVDNTVAGITVPVVSATSTLSTGTEIGSITVDGTTTTLYAPNIDNKLSIGYISENSLFVPNNTGYRYGSGGDYTGIFYFVVPSEPAPLMNTANKTISQVRIIGTNNYADISPSKKFTEPGLYRGYVSDNSFMYEKVGSSAPTYTLSMTGPTINLLADGVAASTITLPIWDGTLD